MYNTCKINKKIDVWVGTCATVANMWGSEVNFWVLAPLLHQERRADHTQVVSLASDFTC